MRSKLVTATLDSGAPATRVTGFLAFVEDANTIGLAVRTIDVDLEVAALLQYTSLVSGAAFVRVQVVNLVLGGG
jgi:hypothetical protein